MSVEKYTVTKEVDTGFTKLPNEVLQGLKNLEALGLWTNLSSRPPTWVFYKDQIRHHFNIGRDKLDKLLRVLKAHNLIEITPTRDEKGQYTNFGLHIKSGKDFTVDKSSKPIQDGASIQYTENPVSGLPVTGKPTPIKKDIQRKNKKTKREARIKRAFPLPKDFALNEESKKLCADLGLKEDVMLTKFKALAKDKAWRSADWQAKFQLIAAKEYKTAAIPQAVKQETKTYKDEIYTPCSVCQRPKLHCECNYNSREQNAMQSAKLKALLQGKLLNK